ncbi:MAG: LacI family transcriptional regulator [Firmicutes bacterium]|nr:LacI family transcriptional regulator [Bacillota bacterium]
MRMKDIANLAGVSIATVSRVINNPEKVKPETREKVQKILEQTNYVANAVARGLVINSMRTIGVLTVDIRDMFFARVIYTIERGFKSLGYNVLLSNTGGEPEEKRRYIQVMLEQQVDGLILVGSVFKERTGNKHILAAGKSVPVVLINSYLAGENIYSILCDEGEGVREAVNYLVKMGHRDIYYFIDTKSFSGLAKLEGFRRGARENGLDETRVLEIPRSLEGGEEGVHRLRAGKKRFSAIITGEDLTAAGAIKALQKLGCKVPGDVSVIGFNNLLLAEMTTPSLTSIDNMGEAMAVAAVQTLYNALQKNPTPPKTVLTPRLVTRESTGEFLA